MQLSFRYTYTSSYFYQLHSYSSIGSHKSQTNSRFVITFMRCCSQGFIAFENKPNVLYTLQSDCSSYCWQYFCSPFVAFGDLSVCQRCRWDTNCMHWPAIYCPGQVYMGTRSSSTRNWGWVVARRRCLNGQLSPVSCQGVPNQAVLSLSLCFIDPALQWRKLYCGRMQTDPWHLCQASTVFLAVCKFDIAIEECCEQGYGWNVWNFAASCHDALNTLDDCSYVYELNMFDPLCKNLAW